MELKDKTAIVCGCTKGIGFAIAELFAANGCNLILFARNEEKLKILQEEWQDTYGVYVRYLLADFSNSDKVKSTIEEFYKNNNVKIDILVNNVGGISPNYLFKSSAESMWEVFERHIMSSHYITIATVSNMKSNDSFGKIINICSNTSISPYYGLGLSSIRASEIYSAKTLAIELAQFKIMVNNILPGATNTEELNKVIHFLAENEGISYVQKYEQIINSLPLKRLAEPIDIAQVALFLASDKCSYITGSNIKVDGGFNVTL